MFGVASIVLKSSDWTECLTTHAPIGWLQNYAWVFIGLVVSGLVIKAATAVFNSYVMRLWNGHVHPDEVAAAKAAIRKIEAKVEADRQEVESFRSELDMLLSANDRMYKEIIALRLDNAQLRQRL